MIMEKKARTINIHYRVKGASRRGLMAVSLLFCSYMLYAQTMIRGTVRDAGTQLPIAFSSVYFKSGKGVVADSLGHFEIQIASDVHELTVSSQGYTTQTISIPSGEGQILNIGLLQDTTKNLSTLVIKSKKKIKYTNKNNPAVELIRKVIENKDKNGPESYDYVEYGQYEKILLSISLVSEKVKSSKLLKRYQFLLENTDTTKVAGKALTPIYLEEKLSHCYFQKDPRNTKTLIEGEKKVNFGEFIDSSGVSSYLSRLYENINVYENNVSLFTNDFLSPIAGMAPSFYMFFIRDTVTDASGTKLVKLYFTPRNTNDFLFRGTMFITLDGHYAVQKLDMTISPNINMNWVREMQIHQEFERDATNGRYHLSKSVIASELGLKKGKSNGMYGERTVSFKNYRINQPHEPAFYAGPSVITLQPSTANADSFWTAGRHDSLTKAEALVYKNIDSLRNMPSYKKFVNMASFALSGYKTFDKFELGPVSTFYSWNPVEGFRLRFGGRTTPNLSKRLYFETYAAYGFKDERWKGFLSFTYSLNNKSVYSFPLSYIRVSAQRETKIPGQELQFVQEDNILLSFKRGQNDKWLYNDIYRIDYVKEWANHFSVSFGWKNWKQTPAGSISFTKGQTPPYEAVDHLTTTELSAKIRWAPKEQFYQGKIYRIPIINKYPIFTFQFTQGIEGLTGGEFNYSKVNLSVEKRMYLSQFGYADMIMEGGATSGRMPFPLLFIHRANQTYAYQLYSYNLMNFMEFVSDRYASLNVDYHFNGFLFNRVPLLQKLSWREIVSAKVLYGGMKSKNDPEGSPELFKLNAENVTTPGTFMLENGSYVEGSVGIGNIFNLLRIDYVKRFTYLDHPDIAKWGIRARVRFDF
jgi:hypothetical protein